MNQRLPLAQRPPPHGGRVITESTFVVPKMGCLSEVREIRLTLGCQSASRRTSASPRFSGSTQ